VAELRQTRPMFDMSLFRKPAFTGVSLGTFAIGAGMFAAFPYITFYLQNALGYSPLGGGLRLLPATVPCFVVPLMVRRLSDRVPARWMLGGGLALIAVGEWLMQHLKVTSSWTELLAGLIVSGVGIGVANPAIARIALGVVEPQRSGMASGISNTFRIAGLATGVAALGALFQDRLAASLSHGLGHPAGGLAKEVASQGIRAAARAAGPGAPAHLVPDALRAFVSGTNDLLLTGAVVVLAGAVAAVVMIRSRDFMSAAPAGSAQAGAGVPSEPEAVPELAG